jgi:hypothetical protein
MSVRRAESISKMFYSYKGLSTAEERTNGNDHSNRRRHITLHYTTEAKSASRNKTLLDKHNNACCEKYQI